MMEKHMIPQYHEDQKPGRHKDEFEPQEKPVGVEQPVNDPETTDSHDQQNDERAGEKTKGKGDQTLGIP